jgi:hypothetical protein
MRSLATAVLLALSCLTDAVPAVSAPLAVTCGALVSTTIKSDVNPSIAAGNAFSSLIGAFVVVTVPAGTTRCIKVIFTPGDSTCGVANQCLVRALASPTMPVFPAPTAANAQHVRSYHEWARRLGAGNYPVQIQINAGGTTFTARNWVMEVQVFQ